MNGRFHGDERGISTLVSHVLALAITSILIVGLIVGANSYLETQKEEVTRNGLETVGNRLAAEVSQVNRLSNRSANVTLYATHQSTVAGAPYDVNVEHGPECTTTTVSSQNCLIVSSARFDIERVIPIENDSAIAVNQTDPGRFEITALERGKRSRRTTVKPTGALVESNMRFGVGADVERDSVGQQSDLLNIAPTNLTIRLDTTTTAAYPRAGRKLQFVVEGEDIDGTIKNYRVNFDGDRNGDFEVDKSVDTSELETTVTYDTQAAGGSYPPSGYDAPGVYNVTLEMTDEDGATRRFTRSLNVSGLAQVALQESPSGSGYDVTLLFRNDHAEPVEIQGVQLTPSDDTTNVIRAGGTSSFNPPWELGFDASNDGNFERTFEADDDYASGIGIRRTISDSGVFSYSRASDGFSTVDSGDEARIRVRGIQSSSSNYRMTVTYLLDGKLVTSEFATGAVGSNELPAGRFSVSDTNPDVGDTVTFDPSASVDPDGTITTYEWDLDGDGSYERTESSDVPVSTTFSSAGEQTVSLRVTDDDGLTGTKEKTIDVGETSADQVDIYSGGSYTDDVFTRGGDSVSYSRARVRVQNDGGEDVTVTGYAVSVTSSSSATQLNYPEAGYNVYLVTSDDGYDNEPYTLGDPPESLDNTAEIDDSGGVATVYLEQFRDASGDGVNVNGETIDLTLTFADGTQQTYTYTLDP